MMKVRMFGLLFGILALASCGQQFSNPDATLTPDTDVVASAPDVAPPTEITPAPAAPAPTESSAEGAINPWLAANFATASVSTGSSMESASTDTAFSMLTGNFKKRTSVEAPALVINATACCSKYGFQVVDAVAPYDRRVAFVNVTIKDLVSLDAFGGAISTTRKYPGMVMFLSNVRIDPKWPMWKSYSKTNYDGMVLDASAATYAEDLTITNWNADTAMDIKSKVAQLVRTKIEGPGHRSLRYWGSGPYYIVDSNISNPGTVGGGTLIWVKDCRNAIFNIYNSQFNGSSKIPADKLQCDAGKKSDLKVNYLTRDPKTTGEMHPMLSH